MTNQEAFEQLRAMRSLIELGDDIVEWLAATVTHVEIAAGEVFITEGDLSRDCYFIVSGQTRVTRNGAELGITGPGEPEGEVALFLGIPRTATTSAISDVKALRLDAADFDSLRGVNNKLAEQLRVGVCRHLARRFDLPTFAGVARDA